MNTEDRDTRRLQRLSELLAELDPPAAQVDRSAALIRAELERASMPSRWSRVPNVLKAAAAIALLLGFGLAAPPVRAWLSGLLDDLRTESAPNAPAPLPPPTPPAPSPDVRVTFPVTGSTFEVTIGEHAGTLVVRAGSSPDGTAEAIGVAGASFLVLPHELRIEGPSSPSAIYTIVLPAQVTSVRLRRPGTADVLQEIDGTRRELRVDLSAR